MNANFATYIEVKGHVEMIQNVTDSWKMLIDILYIYTFCDLPIIAANRRLLRICIDLTFSRTSKNFGNSVSVNPMYIIMVLSEDPI